MLFYMDCEPSDLAALDRSMLTTAVGELLRAHRLGYHLVVFTRGIATWFKANLDLNANEKASLDRIYHDFAQNGRLNRKAKAYIYLACSGSRSTIGPKTTLPILDLANLRLVERTVLLSEHAARDGKIYEFVMHNSRRFHEIPKLHIEHHHGGGSSIEVIFEGIIRDKRIVVGVVDSDKDSPYCAKQGPHAKLKTVMNRVGDNAGVPFAVSLPVREIENVIPYELATKLSSAAGTAFASLLTEIIERERASGENVADSIWWYIDLKEGVSSEKFGRISNQKGKDWLAAKLKSANVDCETRFVVSGFGTSIIDQVTSSNVHLAEFRDHLGKREWTDMFSGFIADIIWPFISSGGYAT